MNYHAAICRHMLSILIFLLGSIFSASSFPETFVIPMTTIKHVAVNGGVDSSNPGLTCINVAPWTNLSNVVHPVAACAGWLAIKNDNKNLIAAALAAKTTKSNILLYYDELNPSGNFHCPGVVFTPCSVISIILAE